MSTQLVPSAEKLRREVAENPDRRAAVREATADLLNEVQRFLARYVALPSEAALEAVSLYALHTWALSACDATPYLLVLSEGPGSGKTRLLEALSYLVRKPWHTTSTTEVALFRRMEAEQPTLMLDEIDAIFRGGASYEGLRSAVNGGNRRGATVTRCDGKYGTREYETFGPKVLAGIDTGFIPATIVDRSVVIRMKRRVGEELARLRPREAAVEAAPLVYTLELWASICCDQLAAIQPELPRALSDRECDAWEPLLAIAEFAHRLDSARAAAVKLSAAPVDDEPTGTMLPSMAAALRPVGWDADPSNATMPPAHGPR
jgi:hypothetical protein